MGRKQRKQRKLTPDEKRLQLLLLGMRHLGKPYRAYREPPSRTPRVFDCSSLTRYLYARIGVRLPRRAIDQAGCGRTIQMKSEEDLAIGDLLFFRGICGNYNPRFREGIGHVAVYVGGGRIVHAKWNGRDGGRVRSDSLPRQLARDKLVIVKRLL